MSTTYSRKTDKIIKPLLAFVFTAVFAVGATLQAVPSPKAATGGDPKVVDTAVLSVGFAPQSIAAAQFFGEACMQPQSEILGYLGKAGSFSHDNAAMAGGLMGTSPSSRFDIRATGIIASNSKNMSSYDVTYLKAITGGSSNGFSGYAAYGYYLATIGVDETSRSAQSPAMRPTVGALMTALYLLSELADVMWKVIFDVLNNVHMFTLFDAESVKIGVSENKLTSTDVLNALKSWTSDIYNAAKGIGGVILPVSLAVSLFSWLVLRKATQLGACFKGYLIRLVFITLNVPLLFGCYKTCLSWCGDSNEGYANHIGAQVVLSTFVDFEGWAKNATLSPPQSLAGGGLITTTRLDSVRKVCYDVNKTCNASGATIGDSVAELDSSAKYHESILTIDNESYTITAGHEHASTKDETLYILNLLSRYGNGTKFTSSDWESAYQSTLVKGNKYGQGAHNDLAVLCSLSCNKNNWINERVSDFAGSLGDKTITLTKSEVLDILKQRFSMDGSPFAAKGTLNCVLTSGTLGSNSFMNIGGGSTPTGAPGTPSGLSPMAMYNYLNTDFKDGMIHVYSPESGSDGDKCEHFSVTSVGSGVLKYLYVLDAIVILGSTVIITYSYGLSLLIANIKAMIKIIPQVILAMIGSMKGIAGALILTFAMVCEIVCTFLVYTIVSDLIYGMYKFIEVPVDAAIQSGANGALMEMKEVFVLAVTIGLLAWLTKEALKWRYAIVTATSESVAAVINKLLGTHVSSPNLSSPTLASTHNMYNAAMGAAGIATAAAAVDGATDLGGQSIGDRLGIGADKSTESSSSTASEETSSMTSSGYDDNERANTDTSPDTEVKRGNGTGETNSDGSKQVESLDEVGNGNASADSSANASANASAKPEKSSDGNAVTSNSENTVEGDEINVEAPEDQQGVFVSDTKSDAPQMAGVTMESKNSDGTTTITKTDENGNIVSEEIKDSNGDTMAVRTIDENGKVTTTRDNGDGTQTVTVTGSDGEVISTTTSETTFERTMDSNAPTAAASLGVVDSVAGNGKSSGNYTQNQQSQNTLIYNVDGTPYTQSDKDAGKPFIMKSPDGNTLSQPSSPAGLKTDSKGNVQAVVAVGADGKQNVYTGEQLSAMTGYHSNVNIAAIPAFAQQPNPQGTVMPGGSESSTNVNIAAMPNFTQAPGGSGTISGNSSSTQTVNIGGQSVQLTQEQMIHGATGAVASGVHTQTINQNMSQYTSQATSINASNMSSNSVSYTSGAAGSTDTVTVNNTMPTGTAGATPTAQYANINISGTDASGGGYYASRDTGSVSSQQTIINNTAAPAAAPASAPAVEAVVVESRTSSPSNSGNINIVPPTSNPGLTGAVGFAGGGSSYFTGGDSVNKTVHNNVNVVVTGGGSSSPSAPAQPAYTGGSSWNVSTFNGNNTTNNTTNMSNMAAAKPKTKDESKEADSELLDGLGEGLNSFAENISEQFKENASTYQFTRKSDKK